jgi:DNA-binding NarL/FixJ family response regulator
VPIIEQGLRLAGDLGASRLTAELLELAQRARLTVETAAAADGTVVVAAPPGRRAFGLTTREAEVLALVAAGLSNQEIADRLFISPKTASVHVSNIYDKLGVNSRVAAAGVAQELGLTEAIGSDGAAGTGGPRSAG